MKELTFINFPTKEDVCKWINQYSKLIDVKSITHDSSVGEYVIFYYWNINIE